MTVAAFFACAGVLALLTITPGLDMALVGRSALSGGRAAGVGASAGVATGTLLWALASAVGVAAVLTASAPAYDALRLAGALYLVVLGVGTWRRARRHASGDPGAPARRRPVGPRAGFRTGLTTNLSNPKIAVFYCTVLPTFIPPNASVFGWTTAFGALHASMGLSWLSSYAWALTRARSALHRPAVRATLDRITGTVLVAFGLRLAAER